jgi:protein TonB
MSRSALTFSLVIHASMLAVLGWSSLSTASHTGLGSSEAGVSFSTGEAGGLVLVDLPPEASPAVEVAPPTPETSFEPPPPVIDVHPTPVATVEVAPPTITTTAVLPRDLPTSTPAKKDRKAQSHTASASGMKSAVPQATAGTTGGSAGGMSRGDGGIGYVPPQFLLRYKPPYPEAARAQRLEGTVLLLVAVDASGHVTNASLQQSCGYTTLDRAALAAVKSWRFSPARQLDRAVAATVVVPIRFTFSG